MRKKPLGAAYLLQPGEAVKIRLKETDKWKNGTVDSVNWHYLQIFVKAGKDNYQFAMTEFPELICRS